VGASGTVWNRETTLQLLTTENADAAAIHSIQVHDIQTHDIQVHDLTGQVVAEGIVALRWDSVRGAGTPGERRARRTSLRRRDPDGWRLVRHQGTVLP
jgi:hypothetical protein